MLSSWLPAAGEVQAKRARAKRQVRFAREEHGDADAGTNGRATAERHGSVLVAVVLCLDVLEAHARVRLGLFNCGLVHLVGLVAEDAAGDCARARRREGDDRRDRPRLLLGHLHLLRLGGDRLRVRREDDAPAVREGAGRVAVRHDRRGLVDLERLLREERAQVGDRQITIRRRVEHVREREQKPRGGVLVGACGADRETALVRPVVCRDALGEHAGRECDDRRHVGGIVEERHRLAARLKHRLLEARDVEERPLEGNRRVGRRSVRVVERGAHDRFEPELGAEPGRSHEQHTGLPHAVVRSEEHRQEPVDLSLRRVGDPNDQIADVAIDERGLQRVGLQGKARKDDLVVLRLRHKGQ